MAIVYGEYGPYDDATGQPVFGNETVPIGGSPVNTSYITRGDYRLPNQGLGGSQMGGGQLEFRDAGGNWVPVTAANAPAGYDPRQDSAAQGSNERLRFDQAFSNAPADVPITDMQQWAMANGWTEPDRSRNEGTFGSMLSNVIPGALAVVGGVGAMGGFGGGFGGFDFGGSSGLSDAAANFGWSDAATAGQSALTDGFGAGVMGSNLADLQGAANQFGWSDGASMGTSTPNADINGAGLWDILKSNISIPKNASKLAQALGNFGTTPTMQSGASMPAFPSSFGGGSSGSTGTAPMMPQAAQQPLATPQFESNFQPMNVVAPQFTGFQQNNPLSDPFAESHATWAGPQYAKALRG